MLIALLQREENISKRRNFQPSAEDTGDSEDDVDLGPAPFAQTLQQMLQAIYSNDQDAQLESTTKFRR